MKNLLIIIFVLSTTALAKSVVAQTCVVHIFSKGWQCKIYVNDKLLTGLNKDEALIYTLPSAGRVTFSAKFADEKSSDITIDTDKDGEVYIIVYKSLMGMYGGTTGKNKLVDLKEWTKESKNFKEVVTMTAE